MSKGWIKLHRKIMDSDGYFDEPFCKNMAWIDLLLLANHDTKVITKRGLKIMVERGQVGYSELSLAKRWKWSRDKVRRFLKYLENGQKGNTTEFEKTIQQIIQQKNRITTLITILNYEKYQEAIQQTIQQTSEKRYTNKNSKNTLIVKPSEKNEKESNRNHNLGEHLFAERYGNQFPKINY
jgi:uncharacterized protein YaaR (DUF327 family)